MKKLLLTLFAIPLFATNGDNLLGAGPVSRGLAGNALIVERSVESIFLNPSNMTKAKRSAAIGATLFLPKVTTDLGNGKAKSKEDFAIIPFTGAIFPISEDEAIGLGLFSISGMGVDYRSYPSSLGLGGIQTNLAFSKLSLAYAKSFEDFQIGFGLDGAYGKLRIRSQLGSNQNNDFLHDLGIGYHIGGTYKWGKTSIALTYTSKTKMKYKNVYDFNLDGRKDDFSLAQPQELALAIGYANEPFSMEFDIKKIWWSDAGGYKDFEWDDQIVVGIGAKYKFDSWIARCGINYAQSPLHDKNYKDFQTAYMNLVGFPAISHTHFAIGWSYLIKNISIDVAVLYSPKSQETYQNITATNKQYSISLGVTYAF